jgi:hypothetical protein
MAAPAGTAPDSRGRAYYRAAHPAHRFVLLLFPLIVEQGTTISAAVPGYYQGLREWMANYPNQLIMRLVPPATQPGAGRANRPQMLASAGQAMVLPFR